MEVRSRMRQAPSRPRAADSSRGRPAAERGPGALDRVAAGLGSGGFWTWCLAKLLALAVLVGALALLYEILTSRYFYASEVTVDGTSLVGAQEVLDAAAVGGVHILWVNGRQAAQRIRLLPGVADAAVHPIFPRRV